MNRIAFAILLCLPAAAAPRLPAILSDHMVLQQGRAVPVWGWADPGERIAVTLAAQTRETVAGKDGRWRVDIGPLPAGGPFRLTVTGNKTVVLNDVLVGEVWLCSGQSNMAFPLSRAETAKEDIPAANQPRLRLFTAARQDRIEPADDTVGAWKAAAPETVRDFSAVAYYFGSEIQRRLNVPVGLVHSSWSGSVAEQWTDGPWLRSDPEFADILTAWERVPAEVRDIFRAPTPYRLELDDFEFLGGGAIADFEDAARGEWTFDWNSPGALAFDLVSPGRGAQGYAGRIAGPFGPGEGRALHFRFSKPVDTRGCRGIRFYARGQGYFKVHVAVPTVTDADNYATAVFRAPAEWGPVEIPFSELKQAGWGRKLPFTPESVSGLGVEPLVSASPGEVHPPSGLYNGMIRPLAPYGIRGAVWYQGEGNSGRAYQYRKLLPAMIRNWRETWGQGDFPFLITQLPNYGRRSVEPGESRWAELREAQVMTLALPQTALTVTIDLGEGADVHPKRKKEVGHRLALTALGQFYGQDIVYSGPVFDSMSVEGSQARVRFRTGPALTVRGGSLKGFAVAGADRKFVWADARIDGDSVVVSSPRVAAPVAVRYAWDSDPECNLYNAEGLPARPFRTDQWR